MNDDLPRGLVHAVASYHGQWLPGDERGFRSRGHRVHSSGDYRNPPPEGEHAELHRHVESRLCRPAVFLRPEQYAVLGTAFVHKLEKLGCEPRVVAACTTHLHAMFIVGADNGRSLFGKAKQYASLKCPNHQGQLWSEGGKLMLIRSRKHMRTAEKYIAEHAGKERAWVWERGRDPVPGRPK